MSIVYDSRWIGPHGIGRFALEIGDRLTGTVIKLTGQDPVSMSGMLNNEVDSLRNKDASAYFSPSYTSPITWRKPLFFTIHDLIHLDIKEEKSHIKTIYYNTIVKKAVKRSEKVFTVSEYSKSRIVDWCNIDEGKIIVLGNGVSSSFSPLGVKKDVGHPYIFYVRNNKPHKNLENLIKAFSILKYRGIFLVLTGQEDDYIRDLSDKLKVRDKIIYTGRISDVELAEYYRGATVVTMPSLYEGFGLPALEGMASGVPVVVSDRTSLPEIVGDAGILVNPTQPESISLGIEKAIGDTALRDFLIKKGIERSQIYTWDRFSNIVNSVIESYTN